MYPNLFENWIGDRVLISTYGVLLAVAFTVAYLEAIRRALSAKENPKHIERIFLVCVVASLVGARLFHILFEEFAYYRENPRQILAVWEGGFVFYGGMVTSLAGIYAYTRLSRLSFLHFLDLITPAVLLGLAIGRIGCLAAGCCWGKTTSLPWGVTFSHPHTLSAIRYVPVHPVQIYESLGALLIFFALRRIGAKKSPEGTLFLTGLGSYAVLRFFVEFFRGDEYRGFLMGGRISLAQFFSLAIAGVILLYAKHRRALRMQAT